LQILVLLLIFLLPACANKSKKIGPSQFKLDNYQAYKDNDFVDHLSQFNRFYNENYQNTLRKSEFAEKYLQSSIEKILLNNELFFKNLKKVKINILRDERPYYFSLPHSEIYISTGLFKKYINHESELMSVISYEMIRLEKKIYNKAMIIPTGYLTIERILSLNRISYEVKNELHKWSFYMLKRSGYDASIYLSWLQILNRNTIDFQSLLGDTSSISREESMFKKFLVDMKEAVSLEEGKTSSSADFYKFINTLGS
jgi:hypothetical protein